MKGKLWLEDFRSITARDKGIRTLRFLLIRHVKRAVGIDPSGIIERDRSAFGCPHRNPSHSSYILAKIVDEHAWSGFRHLQCVLLLNNADRLILLSN